MSPEISERTLRGGDRVRRCSSTARRLRGRRDAVRETPPPYGDTPPGGYRKREPEDYDRALCLSRATWWTSSSRRSPRSGRSSTQHHGAAVKEQFLKRLAAEIERRGALDVLRNGIKDSGCKFRLAYFRPASGLNEETRRLHAANLFAVVRQLRYSAKNENSLDLVLFLNGIPIFTAELKNPLNGQDVEDAIRQYKTDRDPREPLLAYGRCLAHFAVDPDLVYVTTQLAGAEDALPALQPGQVRRRRQPARAAHAQGLRHRLPLGGDLGARQRARPRAPVHPRGRGGGREGPEDRQALPDLPALPAARLRAQARGRRARDAGAGQRYLIQHSAGSGKSFTIAWLAHQLSTLHDADDRRVFDSIVVITDRRVLDRQLQTTMRQFEQTLGVVENIDTTSRQLKEALESGKTIIVTTLQKFPVIAKEIGELPGKRFAVIVDEAHSSQSGESTKSLKAVLASGVARRGGGARRRGRRRPRRSSRARSSPRWRSAGDCPNLSTFAFTATPKPKTLELFGTKRADGKFAPFHLYSMRQAIEEGFILDVLANYTTYKAYWRLLKKIEDDPRYDKKKAEYLLKSFVELHPHAIGEKVRIMVEHFAAQVQGEIGGKAKAMIVTRSRLHAVRYKLAVDKYLAERGYPFKALVAFSGTVQDGGQSYTESGHERLPGGADRQDLRATRVPLPDRRQQVPDRLRPAAAAHDVRGQEARRRERGADALAAQPHASPEKKGTMVLDFANEADEIKAAFEPYYETTLLSEATDPNLLYEVQTRLAAFPVYTEADVDAFAKVYFDPKATQDQLYAVLAPVVERFQALSDGGAARLPRPAHRLRAALRLPRPGADLRRRRPGEALRLRAAPAPAAPRRPRASCRARCSRTSTWSRTASSRPAAARSRSSASPACSTP